MDLGRIYTSFTQAIFYPIPALPLFIGFTDVIHTEK